MAEAKKTTAAKTTTAKKTTTAAKKPAAKTTAAKKTTATKTTAAKKSTTTKKAPAKKVETTKRSNIIKSPAANSILIAKEKEIYNNMSEDKKIIYLEDKVHHLEEENEHLHDRIIHMTEGLAVPHKSTKINKEISIDIDDPFNSLYGDRKSLNARKNFFTFFDLQFHSILKSKLMWILLFVLPMIFTMLFHTIFSLGAATEGLVPGAPAIDLAVQKAFATSLANVLTNWLIAVPLVVFPCIVLPAFIVSSRENNLLKRLTINSVNRSQLFWFYMLSSLIIFSSYLVIMFVVWNAILCAISNTAVGIEIWDSYSAVYHMADVSTTKLLLECLVMFMGLSALGFSKSMKAKESKSFVAWGTGLFIFCQTTKLSVSIVDMNPYLIELEASELTNTIVATLLFLIKYMFIFSPVTWAFVAISTVSRGPSKWSVDGSIHTDEFDNAWSDSPETIFLIIQIIAITILVAIFAYVWYNKNKIIKLETAR